jgi:hypothetical protein
MKYYHFLMILINNKNIINFLILFFLEDFVATFLILHYFFKAVLNILL